MCSAPGIRPAFHSIVTRTSSTTTWPRASSAATRLGSTWFGRLKNRTGLH